MRRDSLFERLEPDAPRHQPACASEQASQRIEAIKRHLEQLLNAREGCSQSSPELGLRDFNGASQGSNDLVIAISADIRRSIEAFEPRINVIAVRFQPDPDEPQRLSFHLDCQVQLDHRDQQVQINVALHGREGYTRVT